MAREVVQTARLEAELKKVVAETPSAGEAFRGFRHVVARRPELGMAVRGRPEFYQLPFHSSGRSFTIVYTFDDDRVSLVALREVPSTVF